MRQDKLGYFSAMRKILSTVHRHTHKIHTHLRTLHVSKRHVVYWIIGICMLTGVLEIITSFLSPPNTKIGGLSVGLKTKRAIVNTITTHRNTPLRFQINNRIYTYYYQDIGIYININEAINDIFSQHTKRFPYNIITFFNSFFSPRILKSPLSFTQEFDTFVQKTIYDFSAGDDIILFNQDEKRMTLYQQEERYGLHPIHIKTYLLRTFGTMTDPLIPPLTPITTDAQHKIQETNTKISDVFSQPLNVIMRVNSGDSFFTIDQEDLQNGTQVEIIEPHNDARFTPTEALLTKYATQVVTAKSKELLLSTKERLSKAIQQSLHDRYIGLSSESIHINLDSGANSDGSLAKKYIEIDISQQSMYTFKNGVLVKKYRVSTGKDYPTPIGTFEILNKTGLGFSTIYNVWMPYWMGFNYSEKLHAYFGIHELPYYYSSGNKIRRPTDFIGVPSTGGCVALDVGDAKEVYKFADIGTKVVIYP